MPWTNEDGLVIRFGEERGEEMPGGYTTGSPYKALVHKFDYTDVANTDTAAPNPHEAFIPAGSVITPFFYVSPHVGGAFLITAFVVVILGGMGSLGGVLIGSLIIALGEGLGALFLPGSLRLVVIFVIFIGVLLFKPTGIFGSGHG